MFPKEPGMLVSMINMKLRDDDISFEDLCADNGEDPEAVRVLLEKAGFKYDERTNSFK